MKLTRDSAVWWLLIVGAVVTYLSQMPPPVDWTWAQWMQSIAALVGIIAGKLATSPLRGANDAMKNDLARFRVLLPLLLALSLGACALKGTPRHQVTVAAVTISDSLIVATDFERAHWREMQLTEAQHKVFQGRMVQVLETAKAIDETILAWPKGTPPPASMKPLVLALKRDLDVALSYVPPSPTKDRITTQLASVWSLLGLVLGG